MDTCIYLNNHSNTFTIRKRRKKTNCLLTHKRINGMQFKYPEELFSLHKKIFSVTCHKIDES